MSQKMKEKEEDTEDGEGEEEEEKEDKEEEARPLVSYLDRWCFEPSQPQRITSGLTSIYRKKSIVQGSVA